MGGALWLPEEEEYFWNVVVPLSDKKLGLDKEKDDIMSWVDLAEMMQEAMDERFRLANKPGAPRQYTHLGLAEHWDKNIMQSRRSKSADKYVKEYLDKMETMDPARWEKRLLRMGLATDEDGNKIKRKRRSGAKTSTPSSAAKRTPARAKKQKRRKVEEEEDEDDEEDDDKPTTPRSARFARSAPSSVSLPPFRSLFDPNGPGSDPTRRQLFTSGRTAAGNDPSYLPGPQFVNRADNPYLPRPRPALDTTAGPLPAPVHRAEVDTERRVLSVNDLVQPRDIREVLREATRAEVASNIGTFAQTGASAAEREMLVAEVLRQLTPFVRDEIRRLYPGLVAEEVARQLPGEVARQLAAQQQQQQQQQQPQQSLPVVGGSGRGEPLFRRPLPTGLPALSSLDGGAAGGVRRTPLPTGRAGQFPTSDARSRVPGRRGDNIVEDEEEDEEERGRRS